MHTVTIDGKEYILRCDLNAYEEIVAKYGDLRTATTITEEDAAEKVVYLLTTLINEHHQYIGEKELLTEKMVSRMLYPVDVMRVYEAIMTEINDAFAPKN